MRISREDLWLKEMPLPAEKKTSFAAFKVTGRQPQRHASGNPNVVVFQSLPTADGEIVVAAANDRLFAKLARTVGRPDWATDPRYASNGLRVANKAVLLPELEAIMRTRSKADWAERLEAAGIPCVAVRYGYNFGQPVDALGADAVVDSLTELL